jgi:NCS1 family nucleobase:cation symporter-1
VFGQAITDPVLIVNKIPNTFVLIIGAITFVIATVGINIVANFVSPAYDLANVAPKYINFQRGGLIAAIGAVVVLPWKIYANPVAINYFLGGLAAFLGPFFGILMVDYYLVKRRQVDIDALYQEGPSSPYSYQGGVNIRAIVSFIISAAISAIFALVPTFGTIAPFSWFIGTLIGGGAYWQPRRRSSSRSRHNNYWGFILVRISGGGATMLSQFATSDTDIPFYRVNFL